MRAGAVIALLTKGALQDWASKPMSAMIARRENFMCGELSRLIMLGEENLVSCAYQMFVFFLTASYRAILMLVVRFRLLVLTEVIEIVTELSACLRMAPPRIESQSNRR
jgi:hypothetical protein